MFDQVSIVPNESLTGFSVQEVMINCWIVNNVLSIPRCRMVMLLIKVYPYNCEINESQMMVYDTGVTVTSSVRRQHGGTT